MSKKRKNILFYALIAAIFLMGLLMRRIASNINFERRYNMTRNEFQKNVATFVIKRYRDGMANWLTVPIKDGEDPPTPARLQMAQAIFKKATGVEGYYNEETDEDKISSFNEIIKYS